MTKNNQIQTDMKYDESYLSNKDWNLNTFATLYHSEKRYFDAEIKRINQVLGSGANVLEIGFGNGKFLQYAKQSGWNVEGTELNPGLIELAKSKGFKVHAVADLSQFASDHYDLIVAFDLLEHLSHEQIENLFFRCEKNLEKRRRVFSQIPQRRLTLWFDEPTWRRDTYHDNWLSKSFIFCSKNWGGVSILRW